MPIISTIPIVLMAIAGGLMVVLFIHRKRLIAQTQTQLLTLAMELEGKRVLLMQLEDQVFPLIKALPPYNYVEEIRNGVISLGMPAEFLMMSWGKPAKIEIPEQWGGSVEVWTYAYEKMPGEWALQQVFMENNRVNNWKEVTHGS